MNRSASIRAASPLATQLSALFARPVIAKELPAFVVGDKPFDPAASERAALRRAVAKFNAGGVSNA